MKKLFTFSIICILASILFASCRSNSSVIKRHYNKGYYFAHSKSKPTVAVAKEEKIAKINIKKPLYNVQNETKQTTLVGTSNQNPITSNGVITASNKKTQQKRIVPQNIKQTLKFKNLTIDQSVKQINTSLKEKIKFIKHNSEDHDGLSLFWIVILVLLILWALGFSLGALGGLIHIVLVIALIFLILWLLGIV